MTPATRRRLPADRTTNFTDIMTNESILQALSDWADQRLDFPEDEMGSCDPIVYYNVEIESKHPWYTGQVAGLESRAAAPGVHFYLDQDLFGTLDADIESEFWFTKVGKGYWTPPHYWRDGGGEPEEFGEFADEEGLLFLLDNKCGGFIRRAILTSALFSWLRKNGFEHEEFFYSRQPAAGPEGPITEGDMVPCREHEADWVVYECGSPGNTSAKFLIGVSTAGQAGAFSSFDSFCEEPGFEECPVVELDKILPVESRAGFAAWLDGNSH